MTAPQQAPTAYAPVVSKTNTLAIVALISSFFVSVVGIILGHVALNQIKTTGEGGRGMAIAALVIGYAAVAITAIVIIAGVAAAAAYQS